MLLYRLQNVNISSDEHSSNEFWRVREIFHENMTDDSNPSRFLVNAIVNSEEELYVKGHTAVWSKGMVEGQLEQRLPLTCFTCDTPIKFAFFCPPEFYSDEPAEFEVKAKPTIEVKKRKPNPGEVGICLIDATTIRVYIPTGEDFRTSLEFPVSNVWQTKLGLLFQRNASKEIVDQEIISMPRLFSISHALNELCPVLIKSNTGAVNLITESDYHVVFTNEENDLVMLYDDRMNRHFLARLRPATIDEKIAVGSKFSYHPL